MSRFVPCTVLLAVTALLVGACQAAAAPLPGRPAGFADLVDRDFIAARVEFQGEPVELVPGPQFGTATLVLRFEQTRMQATGGCNWYGTEPWQMRAGQLIVTEEFSGTAIGCDPASQSQDRWLVDFLTSGPMVRIDGDRYLFASDETVVTFLETDVDELKPDPIRL